MKLKEKIPTEVGILLKLGATLFKQSLYLQQQTLGLMQMQHFHK